MYESCRGNVHKGLHLQFQFKFMSLGTSRRGKIQITKHCVLLNVVWVGRKILYLSHNTQMARPICKPTLIWYNPKQIFTYITQKRRSVAHSDRRC